MGGVLRQLAPAGRLAVVALVLGVGAARADPALEPDGGIHLSELRLGTLNHDLAFPNTKDLRFGPLHHRFEGGVQLNAEISLTSPSALWVIGAPRPRFGVSINTHGSTSAAYADLAWELAGVAGPFAEVYLGGALHDGKLRDANPAAAELGSRILFHLGAEIGIRFDSRFGLSLMWEHMSNSALARRNQGMDNLGVRVGYRFAR